MRSIWLISKTVLIESIRRKEIYAIVFVSILLIGALMTVDFFEIEGITKFYKELSFKIMSIATASTVIVLASRQLPREFENRTIYPLLARPIGRVSFMLGKLFGVMLSGAFCMSIFLVIFIPGFYYLGGSPSWALLGQHLYLQSIALLILATLCFWLSMLLNLDAAITIGFVYYLSSTVMMNAVSVLYDYTEGFGKIVLTLINFLLPHFALLDLSKKLTHSDVWGPLELGIVGQLTLYGGIFIGAYFLAAYICFRRKPI